jgi:TM2 domain-containing membrane protein YozV
VKCRNHPETDATRSCHACLGPLCADCTEEVLGIFYCESCLKERLQAGEAAAPPPPPLPRRRRIKLPFLSGLFSFMIPGLGQVYNGLIARALSQFVIFVLLVWTTAEGISGSLEAIVALLIIGFWFWQIIDAVRTAKDINELGRVPDPDEAEAMGLGALSDVGGGSKGMGVALMVLGGILLFGNLGLSRLVTQLVEGLWPIALLVGGIYLVRRGRDERRAFRAPPAQEPEDLQDYAEAGR